MKFLGHALGYGLFCWTVWELQIPSHLGVILGFAAIPIICLLPEAPTSKEQKP